MPVDTTKPLPSRRLPKTLTEEELQDIERKRLRGELSCAECRRLKLKCDKKLPCSSCERRGCESICPLGILAAGQGTRFILADTEHLHSKIYEMSNRIRQLEDALAILQATVSDQRHPLLTDELLKVKFGSEVFNGRRPPAATRREPSDEPEPATSKGIDALGTLTLGSSGEVHYFGRSAGSEALMLKAGEDVEDPEERDDSTDSEDVLVDLDRLSNLFPFSSRSRPNVNQLQLVESLLPPQERALELCQSYVQHGSFFFRPIKEDELLEELLPSIYAGRGRDEKHGDEEDGLSSVDSGYPHSLAVLCFVLALGALFDLKLGQYNSEAERYYDLGKAALSLKAVFDSPSLDSVRAVGLMATYHSLGSIKYTRDSAWCLMSFAAKVLQSIGLHRDSARWQMDAKTVQKRRNLFWEVFSSDLSHSLALGRPPAIHLSYVDCEFPQDEDATLSDEMEHQQGFWQMKYAFAKNIYYGVAEATLRAQSPSYSAILDIDKKVREISFPKSMNPYVSREVGPEIFHSSSLALRDFYASQNRTVTMLYLHRSFFAQAMLDHPTNPLLSPFAPSFLSAYRSASIIIKASAHLFERCEDVATRVWFLMYHMFSAAVIVGTIVTRCPTSNFTSLAMKDFNAAVQIFERASGKSHRAKIALGVLLKLKEQANRVFQQLENGSGAAQGSSSPTSAQEDDIDSALAIFGGQTRVLEAKNKIGRSDSRASSSASPSASAASPVSLSSVNDSPSSIRAVLGGVNSRTAVSGASGVDGTSEDSSSMDWMWNFDFGQFGGGGTTGMGDIVSAQPVESIGGPLPDVHPSLIEYLNNDAVRRVLSGQGGDMVKSAPGGTDPEAGKPSSSFERDFFSTPTPVLASRPWSISSPGNFGKHSSNGSLGSAVVSAMRPAMQDVEMRQPPPIDAITTLNDMMMSSSSQSSQTPAGTSSHPSTQAGRPVQFKFVNYNHPSSRTGTVRPGGSGSHSRNGSTSGVRSSTTAGTSSGQLGGSVLPNHGFFDPPPDLGSGMNIPQFLTGDVGSSGATPTPSAMDRAGALEFGLSTESWMDVGWVSFMRDCGLMDTDQ